MRFLILGAGGIGGYYGARLQAAGHPVLFIARGDHLKALQQHGLSVTHPEFKFDEKVNAIDQQGLIADYRADDFDLLILAVKAGATEQLMQSLQGWLSLARTPVLSLQNGVDNEISIAAHIGSERTIGGLAVRIGGHIISPGVIEATGVAQVVMGAWKCALDHPKQQEDLKIVADCFNRAAIPTTLSDTIQKALWRKLLINNGVNPLSALTGLDTRTLTSHPVLTRTVYQLMEEVAVAATADGVELERSDIDEMYQLICQFDAIKTSMLVDREKGRPLELDAISGVVVERCGRLGKEASISALIQALLLNQLKVAG